MGYMQARATVHLLASQSTKAKFEQAANQSPGAVRVRGLGQAAYSTSHSLEVFQGGIALGLLSGDLLPAQEAKQLAAAAVKRLK